MNTLTLQLSDDALEKVMAMLANMPKEVVLADIQKNEIVSTAKVNDVTNTSWADFANSLKDKTDVRLSTEALTDAINDSATFAGSQGL